MTGRIIKGIAGFYYVYVEGCGVYECKAKGVFRNRKVKPLVGDRVEIQVIDETEHKGNMEEILPRTSELIRPAVANIAVFFHAEQFTVPCGMFSSVNLLADLSRLHLCVRHQQIDKC